MAINISSKDKKIPFSMWYPFLYGAGYGLLLRIIFSIQHNNFYKFGGWMEAAGGVMSAAFAIFVPVAIGAITVYLSEKKGRCTYLFYIIAP